MTIDIKVASCDDVSVKNGVINFGDVDFFKGTILAARRWVASATSPEGALSSVLQFVCDTLSRGLPEYELWILVGNSAWQPDTRIIRYKRLWKILMEQGFELSTLRPLPEVLVERDGELRFFGVFRLQNASTSVVKMMLSEYRTYMLAIPGGLKIQDFLKIDWLGNVEDDGHFLSAVGNGGGLAIKVVGGFDDQERGLVAIGKPYLIGSLLN
ncbi:hypothetical protein [Andreprevotia sp. IGB-42]|uniref:hypothetical protein n=1 Tax=Andreprevotia sp. IGB-42 TaxID=2497473 RepID=UPI00135A6EB3|nr:hypothetical protein [Andreprevotia sp. IGB-42]